MRAVAICPSDITYADGGWGGSLPAVYGHEAAGVVLQTGPVIAGLAPGGASVLMGGAALGAQSTFDPVTLTSRAQRVLGSKLAAYIGRDIPGLIGLYRARRLKLDELISRRFAFEKINAAMHASRRGEGLRNVVMIGGGT